MAFFGPRDAILRLAKAGVRQGEIARQVGVSRQRVHQVVHGYSTGYRSGMAAEIHSIQGGRCAGCCRRLDVGQGHLHHLISDGQHEPVNLAFVCQPCHRAIHRGLIAVTGWLIEPTPVPACRLRPATPEEARNLEYLRPLIMQIHGRARRQRGTALSECSELPHLEARLENMVVKAKRLYLKLEFLKRGLPISEVARRCGCSRQHLSRVISGRAELDDKLARDIALATGIPKVIVLGGGEKPHERAHSGAGMPSTGEADAEPAGAVCGSPAGCQEG